MSKRIFLVDDSATILLSISNILTKAGFETEKAANAEEALRKFQSGVKHAVCLESVVATSLDAAGR